MLLNLTIEHASTSGLEQVSLRQVTKAAGVSTTAIFQNFKDKADLIAAAADHAIRRDEALHRQLEQRTFPLVCGQLGFADFLASYIELRAPRAETCFLAELLFRAHEYPQCRLALLDWHRSRLQFWQRLVDQHQVPADLARIVASYVVMEELYAHALIGHPQYRMLLLETCRALCDAAFHGGRTGGCASHASMRLGTEPYAIRLPQSPGAGQPVAEQLLRTAVEIINETGLNSLNQRYLAARAGVSSSLITYHYKDKNTLMIQAVWHALVQRIPLQLDPQREPSSVPASLPEWYATLEAMLQVNDPLSPGFYVGLARLSAETCFLTARNPELVPLIAYLRGLEGWGTYRASQAILPSGSNIGRDHAAAFGVWIKSQALLRHTWLNEDTLTRAKVAEAAAQIFPTQGQATSPGAPLPSD